MRINGNIVDPELADRYLSGGRFDFIICENVPYDDATLQLIEQTIEKIWLELSEGKTPLLPGQIRKLEQLVGVAGAGKSTHVQELLKDPYHAAHSIVIDPDDLRKRNGFFEATIKDEMDNGSTYLEADDIALATWQCANIYVMLRLMNMASQNNYSIIRTGKPSGAVTDSVLLHAATAGFQLNTTILHAPFETCEAAVEKRIKSGGHPFKLGGDHYDEHQKFGGRLVDLFRYSDSVQLRWRKNIDEPSHVVAEAKSGELCTVDASGLNSLMATFGEASIERNLAYFTNLHSAHTRQLSL